MTNQFTASTVYFLQEGKQNLPQCLKAAFQSAKQENISKIIIFTGRGEGVKMALDSYCQNPDFKHINLIAVTFPAGKVFTEPDGTEIHVDIPQEDVELFKTHKVPIVRAHLPLDSIKPLYQRGHAGHDLSLVGEALNLFCGSMSLCVQAITMACDAGIIQNGEHVISLTSDTAILAQAAPTSRLLGEFIIREILCKPAVLSISRKEIAERLPTQMQLAVVPPPPVKELPAGEEETSSAETSPDTPTT